MVVIDYVIIAVVLISALVSFARGFLREVLSLAAWSIAIICAFKFAPSAAPYFGKWLSDTSLQYWAAVVAVFLVTLLVCGIVNWLISQLFKEFGTSGTDRSLGILLGAARGVVVVALMLLGAKVISLPVDDWGAEAKLYPQVSKFSEWLWTVGSDMADDLGEKLSPGPDGSTESAAHRSAKGEASLTPEPVADPAAEDTAPGRTEASQSFSTESDAATSANTVDPQAVSVDQPAN